MMKFITLSAFVVALPATQASALETWSCQNNDYEIACKGETCEAAQKGNFTPLSVSFSVGKISVCAYSGCWEGRAKSLRDKNLVYVHAKQMKWSHPGGEPATFQIALDTKTGFATILGENLAEPMHCKADK